MVPKMDEFHKERMDVPFAFPHGTQSHSASLVIKILNVYTLDNISYGCKGISASKIWQP